MLFEYTFLSIDVGKSVQSEANEKLPLDSGKWEEGNPFLY